MTRILVTGGAGYVGSVSVDALLAAGHDVVVLDDLTTGHRAAVPAEATFHQGTYADEAVLARLLEAERIEAILHCAARSLVGESIVDPSRYYRDNVAGGVALLEAARTVGVERLVFSSTAAVYGVPDATPIPEDAPLRPINPYGEIEADVRERAAPGTAAPTACAASASATSTSPARPRPSARTTSRRRTSSRTSCCAAEGGAPLTLFGDDYPTPDGTCIRDYIHVADLADAHLRAIEATAPGDARTDEPLVCNLGNAGGFSVREVLSAAGEVVGSPDPVQRRPAPGRRSAGARGALDARGRRPRLAAGATDLDEMVGSAWAWRRAHPGGYQD